MQFIIYKEGIIVQMNENKIIASLTRTRNSRNYNTSIFHNYNYLTKNYNQIEKNYTYISNESDDDVIDAEYTKE